jgi:hypothetical protein
MMGYLYGAGLQRMAGRQCNPYSWDLTSKRCSYLTLARRIHTRLASITVSTFSPQHRQIRSYFTKTTGTARSLVAYIV